MGIAQEEGGGLGNEGWIFFLVGCYWFYSGFCLWVRRQLIAEGGGGRRTAEAGGACWSDLGKRHAARKDRQERTMRCRLVKAGCRSKKKKKKNQRRGGRGRRKEERWGVGCGPRPKERRRKEIKRKDKEERKKEMKKSKEEKIGKKERRF